MVRVEKVASYNLLEWRTQLTSFSAFIIYVFFFFLNKLPRSNIPFSQLSSVPSLTRDPPPATTPPTHFAPSSNPLSRPLQVAAPSFTPVLRTSSLPDLKKQKKIYNVFSHSRPIIFLASFSLSPFLLAPLIQCSYSLFHTVISVLLPLL